MIRSRFGLLGMMLSAAFTLQCRPTQQSNSTRNSSTTSSPIASSASPQPIGSVEVLTAPKRSVHAYGRAGDLVLVGATGVRLTIAATLDQPGHRPLRGAVLDIGVVSEDRPDPLLWWLPGIVDASGNFHAIATTVVEATQCENAAAGVHIAGAWEDRAIERILCALPDGRFRATTRVTSALHAGERLGEDLVVGTSPAIIERLGQTWEGEQRTGFIALAEHGLAALFETPDTIVRRKPIRIATEVFPAPITVWHEGVTNVTQHLRVITGDALDALAIAGPGRSIEVVMPEGRRGAITITDSDAKPMAVGDLSPGSSRTITIPKELGAALSVRDERGITSRAAFPAEGAPNRVNIAPQPTGILRLHYEGPAHQALPVHVLLRGIAPTPDPTPAAMEPDRAGGNSLYLRRGTADVTIPAGRYRITATHGFTWSLSSKEVTMTDGALELTDILRPAIDTSAYTSGDFHLHSAPSPDSTVSLEARVLTLLCEGVDFGVATDHNRISDFAPHVHSLGATDSLATMVGNEITAGGKLWGHFNAFPLKPTDAAPEDAVSIYFQQKPADIFAAARRAGAQVLQVNHPRMPPSIGYFELTHLDARTGQADAEFSNDFNAVEAFNGIWLETPEKVREGLRDLVGLVRRGMRPTATGNSDSHTLLFEEAGYPRTFVQTRSLPVATRGERVIEALMRGQTTVSSGPLVELTVEGQSPGATVRPSLAPRGRTAGKVRAHVRVSAAAWIPVERVELWVDDQVALTLPVTGPARDGIRFEKDVDLPIRADAVIAAWADAEAPLPEVLPYAHARAIGFSSFVYVDADGDGRISVPSGAAATPPVNITLPTHHH